MQVFPPVFQPAITEYRYELEITYDSSYRRSYFFDNFISLNELLNLMALEGILHNKLVDFSVRYTPAFTN